MNNLASSHSYESKKSFTTRALLVVGSVSLIFLLRLVVVIVFGNIDASDLSRVGGDHSVYFSTAKELASNGEAWFQPGSEFGYRAPLYFAFLSALYWVNNEPSYVLGQIGTALLASINCLLVYFLARETVDGSSAKVSMWIRGFSPPFVIADTFVLSEPLFATFLLSALLLLYASSKDYSLLYPGLLGAMIGCCMLTREVALAYPGIIAGCMFLLPGSKRIKIKRFLIFIFSLLLVLSPWLLRNVMVWGKPFPLSYTSGINLHIGNNPESNGRWAKPPETNMPSEIKWGTPEYDSWHRQQAISFIMKNPTQFVILGMKRMAWFLWPRFLRDDIQVVYGWTPRVSLTISMICGLTSACIFILGILGFVMRARDWFWWVSATIFFLYSNRHFCCSRKSPLSRSN